MLNKNTVDFSKNISPIDFAREMLKNTDEDSKLYLNEWYDVDCEDCMTYNNYVAKINWDSNDLADIISDFNAMISDFDFIANILKEYDATFENLPELLVDNSLLGTYYVYLAPFDATNQQELEVDVVSRLSEGLCGYEIIRHSQRLCRLYSLNAPKLVIQYEERMLIASLIIHDFAEKFEKV